MPAKALTSKAPKKSNSVNDYFLGIGRRKTSVARVRLHKNGTGDMIVNEKPGKDYFNVDGLIDVILAPLKLTSLTKKFDITVKVDGGGTVSQADAVRHGVARALLLFDDALRTTLKRGGFLTRDARSKERKKPGLRRARRAPQFSKR